MAFLRQILTHNGQCVIGGSFFFRAPRSADGISPVPDRDRDGRHLPRGRDRFASCRPETHRIGSYSTEIETGKQQDGKQQEEDLLLEFRLLQSWRKALLPLPSRLLLLAGVPSIILACRTQERVQRDAVCQGRKEGGSS